jgi:branched-subunit amino acid aminotransferase/4-amino-4-deoxychorismate lyase
MEPNGMELNGAPATVEQIRALALTNYGHFTSMLVENDRVRGLSLHVQRLSRDCDHLFGAELDTEHVRHYVRHALAGTRQPTVIRVTVYDPALDLGTIGNTATPHVLVTVRTAGSPSRDPLRLQAVSYSRDIPAIKHVGLFGTLQRRREAQRAGFDDALFLNPDGTISEIATSNIGFVRDGRVIWPRAEVLAGVTMRLVHQALDEPVTTEALTLSDLPDLDAAFATNAATGVRSVSSVDAIEWPTGNETVKELRELYADIPSELV